MSNILSRWASNIEYKLYYNRQLICAEQYSSPYVLVYDIDSIVNSDWTYMWHKVWASDRNCTPLCNDYFVEWVVCDEDNAIKLLLKEHVHIIDHYPFAKYVELVKTYCDFKEDHARGIVADTKIVFPSYKALQI